MTAHRPSVSILVLWTGPESAHALRSALRQRGGDIEILVIHSPRNAAPETDDPRVRTITTAGGGKAAPLAEGFAAARGALCAIADEDAHWAEDEMTARAALFPECGAARLLILPRPGASGARCGPRTGFGDRAAALMFRDGAPPPLSALCAPACILRAARPTPSAGRWAATLLALSAEAAGARVEAPFGPWRAQNRPCPESGIDGARAALSLAAPLLTPRERLWAEIRLLGPGLSALAPHDARRLGWRGLRAGGARRAALTLLTARLGPVAIRPS
jgi:hypothetical protein